MISIPQLNPDPVPPGPDIEKVEVLCLNLQTFVLLFDLDPDNYVWQAADFISRKIRGETAEIGPEVISNLKALAVTLNVPEKHFLYEAMHYIAENIKT